MTTDDQGVRGAAASASPGTDLHVEAIKRLAALFEEYAEYSDVQAKRQSSRTLKYGRACEAAALRVAAVETRKLLDAMPLPTPPKAKP